MKNLQKSTAIVLVFIGILVFALIISVASGYQKVAMVKNTHQLELTEYNRSSDQKDTRIDNLVKMVNIFTGGKPVLVTAYNAHPNQTDDTPTITANNTKVADGTLALSRDFIKRFDPGNDVAFGDTVLLIVPMRVEDTMKASYINRADIFMWNYLDAVAFGVKEGMVCYD